MSKQPNLQERMVSESNLIIASVDWIEGEINKKLELFEKFLYQNKIKEASFTEKEIMVLLRRLDSEKLEMDKYMEKYTKLVQEEKENYEKAKILYDSKQRKAS